MTSAANNSTAPTGVLQWPDYLARLEPTQKLLELLADPTDPLAQQEAFRLFFLSLGTGYLTAFADPDHPDFVPAVNTIFSASSANPDFVYYQASVRGEGVYRITGYRGTTLFVLFDIASGGLGVMDELGPSLGSFDLDDMKIEANGYFEITLSQTRPENYSGNWVKLEPSARAIVIRQASYDWGKEVEGKFAIERVDSKLGPPRLNAEQISQRLARLASHPQRYAGMWMKHMAAMRSRGLINKFEVDDWAGRGGVAGQYYYQGLFELGARQALVIETELPEKCLYWNVQLSDPLWNAIDWLNRQSSLNAHQARIDSDGKFRAVIAVEDPGVPNWLDPGGYTQGSVMIRWNRSTSGPVPTLRLVPIGRVREYLAADTPGITAQERDTALRERRRHVQLRRRW